MSIVSIVLLDTQGAASQRDATSPSRLSRIITNVFSGGDQVNKNPAMLIIEAAEIRQRSTEPESPLSEIKGGQKSSDSF